MVDAGLSEGIKQVEAVLKWWESELSRGAEPVLGLTQVCKVLRQVMLLVEQQEQKPGGPLEAVIINDQQACGISGTPGHGGPGHVHTRLVTFSSRGEFFVRAFIEVPQVQRTLPMLETRGMSPREILGAGVPPARIIEGIKTSLHALVIGEQATQKPAQA